jgi:hypothetical protein
MSVVRQRCDQEDPRHQREANRDNRRVDQACPVAPGVTLADHGHQPDADYRVAREVEEIGNRDAGQRHAEQRLIVVGEHVAANEQDLAYREYTPCPARGRPMHANTDNHRDDAAEPDRVIRRPAVEKPAKVDTHEGRDQSQI